MNHQAFGAGNGNGGEDAANWNDVRNRWENRGVGHQPPPYLRQQQGAPMGGMPGAPRMPPAPQEPIMWQGMGFPGYRAPVMLRPGPFAQHPPANPFPYPPVPFHNFGPMRHPHPAQAAQAAQAAQRSLEELSAEFWNMRKEMEEAHAREVLGLHEQLLNRENLIDSMRDEIEYLTNECTFLKGELSGRSQKDARIEEDGGNADEIQIEGVVVAAQLNRGGIQIKKEIEEEREQVEDPDHRIFEAACQKARKYWRQKKEQDLPDHGLSEQVAPYVTLDKLSACLFNPAGRQVVPQPVRKVNNKAHCFQSVTCSKRAAWMQLTEGVKEEWGIATQKVKALQEEQERMGIVKLLTAGEYKHVK